MSKLWQKAISGVHNAAPAPLIKRVYRGRLPPVSSSLALFEAHLQVRLPTELRDVIRVRLFFSLFPSLTHSARSATCIPPNCFCYSTHPHTPTPSPKEHGGRQASKGTPFVCREQTGGSIFHNAGPALRPVLSKQWHHGVLIDGPVPFHTVHACQTVGN